jgi:prephenate dehydrogenase
MASPVPFRRVAIIGTGLIGGSFAMALRRQFPQTNFVGFSRSGSAARAVARGAIDEAAADLASAVRGADLVYVALPIGATIEALGTIAKNAEQHALVTDAGSTKGAICQAAREHFHGDALFLGGHPMAGKEHSGIDQADPELFRGAPYILMGTEATSDWRVKQFQQVAGSIGAQPIWCDPDTHDWAVGIVSHLPQLVAVALAQVVDDETDETGLPLSLAGTGLQDTLRLAGSPYSVWRDILLTNSDNISRALDRLAQTVEYLRTNLTERALEHEFREANQLYSRLRKPL